MKSAKRKIVGRSKKAGGYEYGCETSYHKSPYHRYYKIGISNSIGNSFCSIDSKEKEFERLDKYVNLGGAILGTAKGYGVSENVLGLWIEARSTRHQIII